ncbi:hypothetical protein L6452_20351 [Arctium lappa]|uniref:Uncharacterized protein n=1 Tax=Arctium lappa TaxID=4217 RepID=A0ACB9BAD1_ARCLA|nr:hypothetical protein L6452_20351 [Arctium lappa]
MKINKACDLSSISVLPPHSRFSFIFTALNVQVELWNLNLYTSSASAECVGMESSDFIRRSGISSSLPEMSSTFRHSQAPSQQQQQQQRSQQSLSQGLSSQHHAIFSQFSQNSQDETLTNDQNKGQEELKSSLHGDLKLISDQLNQDTCNKNSQDISILLSGLQEKIGVFILNLRNDLSKSFTNEMQAIACKLKALDQKNPPPTVLPPKAVSYCANPPGKSPKIPVVRPKVEMGTWNSVKREQQREWRVVIESDEDIDGGFTFLSEEKETGKNLFNGESKGRN